MPSPSRVRIGAFNCENLFERPAVLAGSDTKTKLECVAALQTELSKSTFNSNAIDQILEQLEGVVELNQVRGNYRAQGAGRDTWLGWPEFVQTRIEDAAVANTARVISDIDCDILCTPEVENRWTLVNFLSRVMARDFPAFERYLEVLLFDGNDERGIDVGMLSRFPLTHLTTHIRERGSYFGRSVPLFSRDCPEYAFDLGGGHVLTVLGNHLKSRTPPRLNELPSGQSDTESRQRRRMQAERVAALAARYDLTRDLVAVTGDLNDYPGSTSLEPLMNVAGLHNLNDDRGTHRDEALPIDYLLVSTPLRDRLISELTIERRGIFLSGSPALSRYASVVSEQTSASDHAAIWADFDLSDLD